MFKFLPLVWSNLRRRRLRLLFTLASIFVAFLLFALLEAMRYGFGVGVDLAGADRLMTLQKVSIIQPLPASYGNRIRGVQGVERVSSVTWYGGVFRDERSQIPVFPVEAEQYLQIYSEMVVLPEDQKRAWLAERSGAVVGRALAQLFGWKIGDVVPMRSSIWRKANGSDTWELKIAGIYDAKEGMGDTRNMLMHYDYFNEARNPPGRDMVGWYVLQVADPQAAPEIARKIDGMFANSPYETETSTEKAMAQQFSNQIGNIGAILMAVVGAVFFTMLLVTANTMGQSVRERTNELAVLKTLGFSSVSVMMLVLFEAVFITVLGGALGLGFAAMAIAGLGPVIEQFLPVFKIPPASLIAAVVLMVALGLLAGALPAAQALRLRIVEALRKG